MDLLLEALPLYSPIHNDEIQSMRDELDALLAGGEKECDNMVIASDPHEDTDDILMIKYILTRLRGKKYVILSGGIFSPDERFDHLKCVFPQFQSAQFDVPFGDIIFLRDGTIFNHPVKCFVNCGPCHSITLKSIFDQIMISNGKIITVGANSDGSAAGINQKQTDEGVLKELCWNEYITMFKVNTFTGKIMNLDVNVSRYVLLPHPSRINGPYSEMPPECFDEIIYTTAMFFASRPPPKFALRVNEGNSVVVSQLIDVMSYKDTPQFHYGLELISKYAALCPTREVAVSAAIPLMATALMGGVYKEGMFGFDPKDRTAKETVSCLTPDSVQVFIQNIRKLEKFTPGYDLLAVILAC